MVIGCFLLVARRSNAGKARRRAPLQALSASTSRYVVRLMPRCRLHNRRQHSYVCARGSEIGQSGAHLLGDPPISKLGSHLHVLLVRVRDHGVRSMRVPEQIHMHTSEAIHEPTTQENGGSKRRT